MQQVILILAGISAFATVGICAAAYVNIGLIRKMEENRRLEQNRFQDLLQAIIIATLISGPNGTTFLGSSKEAFLKHYTGGTPVFKE